MTSAFASMDHTHLDQTAMNMHTAEDTPIMMSRRKRTACAANAHDGDGTYHNKVGCFMGDSDAATKFRKAFEQPTQQWRKALFTPSAVHELTAGCPITQKTCDLGARKYAGDLTSANVVTDACSAAVQ
eukprot:5501099-Pyramimonas_sp.AAC.1